MTPLVCPNCETVVWWSLPRLGDKCFDCGTAVVVCSCGAVSAEREHTSTCMVSVAKQLLLKEAERA